MTAARLASLCSALFVLNLLYCTTALFTDGLPGWKMFETVEAIDYRLTAEDGQALDVRAVLPRGAHLIDQVQLRRVVAFICNRRGAPLWFEPTRGSQGRWVRAGSCEDDVQH